MSGKTWIGRLNFRKIQIPLKLVYGFTTQMYFCAIWQVDFWNLNETKKRRRIYKLRFKQRSRIYRSIWRERFIIRNWRLAKQVQNPQRGCHQHSATHSTGQRRHPQGGFLLSPREKSVLHRRLSNRFNPAHPDNPG